VQLRLFAPVLPFVTEEVWSWWQSGSVHRSAWPVAGELAAAGEGADQISLEVASDVLGAVRRAKTAAKRSMRSEVERLTVTDTPARLEALSAVADDVGQAGGVVDLVTTPGDEPDIDVVLAPEA